MKLIRLFIFFGILISLLITSCSRNVAIDNEPLDTNYGGSKTLIAYFSFSGNTMELANMIEEEVSGDIFRIVPEIPYTNDDVYNRAQSELNGKIRPALKAHLDKDIFANYELIILGFPIWWYDLPMPVWSFVEEYDFSGKTVIPFYTHNGSSSGASSLETLKSLLPNSDFKQDKALSIEDHVFHLQKVKFANHPFFLPQVNQVNHQGCLKKSNAKIYR